MKVVIIGCGKVGTTLAMQLCKENHDVVLIDISQERLSKVSDELDAIKIHGNGASVSIQNEAGISNTDILIAVTGEDELNLLCCLIAKKAGKCQTIARVRNHIYYDEIDFIQKQMGISKIINPELETANEISKIIRFPSAIEIDSFAKGKVELLKFKVTSSFNLDGLSIKEIDQRNHSNILICGIERGEDTFIPDGDFIVHNNDFVSIIGTPTHSNQFFNEIGIKKSDIHNIMIIGGGTIALYLCRSLEKMNFNIKLFEKDENRCQYLSEILEKSYIICGDGTDRHLLQEERIDKAEAFITLTNFDEENMILSLFAKENTNAKTITKINHVYLDEFIHKLDLGTTMYPKYITSDIILQYVRSLDHHSGSNVETLHRIFNNKAEALEFKITKDSPITNKPLLDLKLRKNILIGCIYRDETIIIPHGKDMLKQGDTVIVISAIEGLNDICDILD